MVLVTAEEGCACCTCRCWCNSWRRRTRAFGSTTGPGQRYSWTVRESDVGLEVEMDNVVTYRYGTIVSLMYNRVQRIMELRE
jgi:hypothetical protein